jgi:hypothetical protein
LGSWERGKIQILTFFSTVLKENFLFSFGVDFIALTEGGVLRDLGVNSVIIVRWRGEWAPIITLAGGPIYYLRYCF